VDDDFINARLEKEGIIQPQVKPQQEIKLAEPIVIPDDKAMLRKVNAENQDLREQLVKQQAEMQEMKAMFDKDAIKAMIEAKVKELTNQK
jgi:uncharacterized protein (DUF342 family)